MTNKWRIYWRRGRALRRCTSSSDKWQLHKSYSSETDARTVMELLESRYTLPDGFKKRQLKLLSPDQEG